MTLELTNEIIAWCRAEHFSFMWGDTLALIVALVFICIAIICREVKVPVSDDVEKFHKNERTLTIATVSFLYGAILLIIWFLWRTKSLNGY